jgi:hypothetical protein
VTKGSRIMTEIPDGTLKAAPRTVENLILHEIAGRNGTAETHRLLGTSGRGRTEAVRSILLNVLDHIAEYGYEDEQPYKH